MAATFFPKPKSNSATEPRKLVLIDIDTLFSECDEEDHPSLYGSYEIFNIILRLNETSAAYDVGLIATIQNPNIVEFRSPHEILYTLSIPDTLNPHLQKLFLVEKNEYFILPKEVNVDNNNGDIYHDVTDKEAQLDAYQHILLITYDPLLNLPQFKGQISKLLGHPPGSLDRHDVTAFNLIKNADTHSEPPHVYLDIDQTLFNRVLTIYHQTITLGEYVLDFLATCAPLITVSGLTARASDIVLLEGEKMEDLSNALRLGLIYDCDIIIQTANNQLHDELTIEMDETCYMGNRQGKPYKITAMKEKEEGKNRIACLIDDNPNEIAAVHQSEHPNFLTIRVYAYGGFNQRDITLALEKFLKPTHTNQDASSTNQNASLLYQSS